MHGQQISDNEIYLLIKYIKSVLWRVSKRLSYIEDARCLKVNGINEFLPVPFIRLGWCGWNSVQCRSPHNALKSGCYIHEYGFTVSRTSLKLCSYFLYFSSNLEKINRYAKCPQNICRVMGEFRENRCCESRTSLGDVKECLSALYAFIVRFRQSSF